MLACRVNDTTRAIYVVTLYADGYAHTALSKTIRPKDPEAALKAKLEAAAKSAKSLQPRLESRNPPTFPV